MTGKRILIVDDDALVRNANSRLLEHMGYTVFQASGAVEAVYLISDKKLDLVITDNDMRPGRSGVELTAIIKEIEPHLPVFIFTGSDELGEHQADAVFKKPMGILALLAAVKEKLPLKT